MGSKGSSDQVQTQEPWGAQAPYLKGGFQEAYKQFNQGGPQYFPDATYVPFSSQTEQALSMTQQRALNGSPVTNAAQNLAAQSLNSRPQFSGAQNYMNQGPSFNTFAQQVGVGQAPQLPQNFQGPNASGMANVGQGIQNFSQANQQAGVGQNTNFNQANQQAGVGQNIMGLQESIQNFTNQLNGLPDVTQNALSQTAQGANLEGNPYLDNQFDIAAKKVTDTFNRDVNPNIAAQFSLAGRTGSDAQLDAQTQAAGKVSDSLSQLANQIYGGNYQKERDRQLNAANSLGSLSQSAQSLGLQAVGQGANLYNQGQNQDIQRRNLALNFGQQNDQNDIQRRNLAANLYNQGQNQDIQRRSLESQNIFNTGNQALTARGQDLQGALTAGQQDINRRTLAGNLFNQSQGQQLQAANIDSDVYGQQLSQQNQLANMSGQLANQDYMNIDRLMGVGGRVEDLGRQALTDRINRFNFYQNRPQQNLQNYLANIRGSYGNVNTAQGGGANKAQGALGGAMAGAQLGSQIYPGWGTAIGAIGGGLLGYMG